MADAYLHHPATCIACTGMLLFGLCGCTDYAYHWKRMKYTGGDKPKERTLGIIHLDDKSPDDDDLELHLTKKRGGYGIETPLYRSDLGNIHFVTSKSKEYRYFGGIQMRISF